MLTVVALASGQTSVQITVSKISKINAIVGTIYNPSGSISNTSCYTYLHNTSGKTATFYNVGNLTSNYLKLHWVAVGV